MKRSWQPPRIERYSPGRKDARIPEAQAMLKMRGTLAGLEPSGLSACFNLKTETAAKLIELERQRRAAAE